MTHKPAVDLIAEKNAYHYFTTEGEAEVHRLMANIGAGNGSGADPRTAFLQFIQKPYIEPKTNDLAKRLFGDTAIDHARVEEIANDILYSIINDPQNPRYFKGENKSWSHFSQDFQIRMSRRLQAECNHQQEEHALRQQLVPDLSDPQHAPDVQDVVASNRTDAAVRKWVETTLSPRQEEVIRSRYLDDKQTLEQVGDHLGLTSVRVREIEGKAIRRLRGSSCMFNELADRAYRQ